MWQHAPVTDADPAPTRPDLPPPIANPSISAMVGFGQPITACSPDSTASP